MTYTYAPEGWIPMNARRTLEKHGIQQPSSKRLATLCSEMAQDHREHITSNRIKTQNVSPERAANAADKEVRDYVVKRVKTRYGKIVWAVNENYIDELKEREQEKIYADTFISSASSIIRDDYGICNVTGNIDNNIAELVSTYASIMLEQGISHNDAKKAINKNIAYKAESGHWAIHPRYIDDLKQHIEAKKTWLSSGGHNSLNERLGISFHTKAYDIAMERFHDAKIETLMPEFKSREDAAQYVETHIVKEKIGKRENICWEVHEDYAEELKDHLFDPRIDTWQSTQAIASESEELNQFAISKRVKRYTERLQSTLEESGMPTTKATQFIEDNVATKLSQRTAGTGFYVNPEHVAPILAFTARKPITTQLGIPNLDLNATQAENLKTLKEAVLYPARQETSR